MIKISYQIQETYGFIDVPPVSLKAIKIPITRAAGQEESDLISLII